VILTGFVSASILFLTVWLTSRQTIRQVEESIGLRTIQELELLTEPLTHVNSGFLPGSLPTQVRDLLELEPSVVRVDLFVEESGKIRVAASSSPRFDRPLFSGENDCFQSGSICSFVVENAGARQLITVRPFRFRDGNRGFMTVINSLEIVDSILSTRSRISLVSMTMTLLLLVGGVILIFRTTVYRNIRHLVEVMQAFKSGDSGVRVTRTGPGEFEVISNHLNSMLAEIEQLHQDMQARIDYATRELEQRNQDLESLNVQLIESQRRRIQTERLALAGRLTTAFAHDVGSPLGAVSTHLQLLLEDRKLPEDARRRVALANEQIERVCSIVESILSTTRLKDDKSPVNLVEVIRKIQLLMGPSFQHRGVQFQASHPSEECWIDGNSDQLQQLFINLINNALDAIDRDGRISIRIESDVSVPVWLITVEDNGCGIPADQIATIFEPFITHKKKGKGTGLGLAVSQEIVARHGGTISVESTPGEGTRFLIRLPQRISGEETNSDDNR